MILTYIEHESLVPAFIEKHLGSQAVADFKKGCAEGIKPISENASYEEKYETAYSDWIWMGGTAFSFVRKHLYDIIFMNREHIVIDKEGYRAEHHLPFGLVTLK